MSRFIEKASRYLALFGLSSDYSIDELHNSYRTLAKLNHPDLSDDPEAAMRMVIINDAHEFLTNERAAVRTLDLLQRKQPDPAYAGYRAAFDIMSRAFLDYYGEGDKSFQSDMEYLKSELQSAKKGFADVIEKYPSSRWTADAIDRVFSINKWL